MKVYPLFEKRKTIDLDGLWDFKYLGDVDRDSLNVEKIAFNDRLCVPGAFDALPAYAGKRGLAVYRTNLDITPGRNARLCFQSVGIWCRIYVDGKAVRDHHPAYTAFSCDLPTSSCQRREIVVVVDSRYDTEFSPLQENFFDFYHYGGILRSVTAYELPDVFIDYCHVEVENYLKGEVSCRLGLAGHCPETVEVKAILDDQQEECLGKLQIRDGLVSFSLSIRNPAIWEPETPNLHTLRIETEQDAIMTRIGLREVRAENGKVLLNGKPVKLLGFCRHEAHPQFGPSLPDQLLLADIQLLKDMGCNFVRGSHYPQDQRFLDLCDEMGMLVFEESMGWGQNKDHFTDPAFVQGQLQQTEEMIMTSFNHPSVIMWGFLNEGESCAEESRACYEQLIGLIRSLDPSRVVDNDKIAGISIWQFCDCRTYTAARSLGRPRGFNNKGVLDEYRRPKMAYDTVKKVFGKQ